MLHACFASWKRPLDVKRLTRTAAVSSSSKYRPRSRREGRREGSSFSASAGGREEEDDSRSPGGRQYHHWSPPGVATGEKDADGALLNSLGDAETATVAQYSKHRPQPAVRRKAASKSPQAVAMEEFAALERKLAPPRATPRKTPEQVAMEEFTALERKLGPAAGAGAAGSAKRSGGSRGSPSSSMPRPEEPDAAECCGNGCATCVWIGYWEELQAWEEAQREREEVPP
ncbi:unnamed protein product [Scytosiphon promiscuus]